MNRFVTLIVAAWLLLPLTSVRGQEKNPFDVGLPKKPARASSSSTDRLKLGATIEPQTVRRGQDVTLKVLLDIQPGFHTYPTKQADKNAASTVTTIKLESAALTQVGDWRNPPGLTRPEPALDILALEYYEGRVTIEGTLRVKPNATPGRHEFTVTVSGQVCDEQGCVPFRDAPSLTLTISEEPAVTPTAASDPAAKVENASEPDLWNFIVIGLGAGILSVLTPCVFPMIPITVSFFLKQSQQANHRPMLLASVYTVTIVVVLTLGAVLMLTTFKALSQHWLTNIVIGGLFIFFALSLFGMYEIELPSGLARFTSSREGQGGVVGTIFMALTFTIVSFACVAPFMGAFAGLATKFPMHVQFLGGLAYAGAFASPFFFLALFPALLKGLPKSGSWLNTMKVVMGFLELAAAIKFLRAGELIYGGEAHFLTFELSLGLYVALGILAGLYLLNLFRLPHDTPAEHLGVPRMIFSLVFLSLSLYLLPGLTQQRPSGKIYAWMESFLLPDPDSGAAAAKVGGRDPVGQVGEGLVWRGNMQDALRVAGASEPKKLVFIDFTGIG